MGLSLLLALCLALSAAWSAEAADRVTPRVLVAADPVVTLWDGSSFEFVGKADTWFNMIYAPEDTINVHLKTAGLSSKANGGTLVDAVALRYKDSSVVVTVDEEAAIIVTLTGSNGQRVIRKADLATTAPHTLEVPLDSDATVIVDLYRPVLGHSVRIVTPTLKLTVYPTLPGLDEYYQEYLPAYLNFEVDLKDAEIEAIHGLLGQSAPASNAQKGKPAKAAGTTSPNISLYSGEGTEEDFIVSGPLASDFNFSHAVRAQPAISVSRKLLIEPIKAKLAHPIAASMRLHSK